MVMGDMTPGRDWGNGDIAWVIDTTKRVIAIRLWSGMRGNGRKSTLC